MIFLMVSLATLKINYYPVGESKIENLNLILNPKYIKVFTPEIKAGMIFYTEDGLKTAFAPLDVSFLFNSRVRGFSLSMGPGVILPVSAEKDARFSPSVISPQAKLKIQGRLFNLNWGAVYTYIIQESCRSSIFDFSVTFGESLLIGLNSEMFLLNARGTFYDQINSGIKIEYPLSSHLKFLLGISIGVYTPISEENLESINENYWTANYLSRWMVLTGIGFHPEKRKVKRQKGVEVYVEVTDSIGNSLKADLSIDGVGDVRLSKPEKIKLPEGNYNVSVYSDGYQPLDTLLIAREGMYFHVVLKKNEKKGGIRLFCIDNEDMAPIKARIDIINSRVINLSTDDKGCLSISLKPDTYIFKFSCNGFLPVSKMYDVSEDSVIVDTVFLERVR